jgi:hypothetical protein
MPDALDTRGFDALRMTISYVLLQMILPLEDLLPVVKRTDGARVAFVLVRCTMSKKSISPCIRLVAKGLRTSPGFVWRSFGVLVQFLKVPEQHVALLANMALLVFVWPLRPCRRDRICHTGQRLEASRKRTPWLARTDRIEGTLTCVECEARVHLMRELIEWFHERQNSIVRIRTALTRMCSLVGQSHGTIKSIRAVVDTGRLNRIPPARDILPTRALSYVQKWVRTLIEWIH